MSRAEPPPVQSSGDARAAPTASARPAQAAATVAGARPPGDLPDAGPQHPAAVQRQAGQQVEDADDQVGEISCVDQHAGRPCRGDDLVTSAEPTPASTSESSGPAAATSELPAGRRRLLLDLGDAAERVQQDPADRQLEGAGHHAVAQLVDEHRGVEQARTKAAATR